MAHVVQNIYLIRDEKGNPLYLGNIITDITERKKVEDASRENEEKYKSLFESAGDAIFIMDVSEERGARFLDCSKQCCSSVSELPTHWCRRD